MLRPGAPAGLFHEGELALQQRAGVRDEAERLSGMLAPPHLDGSMSRFLADRELVMITSRDAEDRLWTSAIWGVAGFVEAHDTTVTIRALPQAGDPLHELQAGNRVGLLAIDFGRRRRLRMNGTLTGVSADAAEVVVEQAFGNCPRYIQQRQVSGTATAKSSPAFRRRRHSALGPEETAVITRADTFILGTEHPVRGSDTSHRGGAPGFVRVENGEIWWPDYPGNNLFNSLGNLFVDSSASMLFIDFDAGRSLQLTGRATLEWVSPGTAGDDGGTGRRTRFTPSEAVTIVGLPRAADHVPSANNPPLI